jgi:carbonic anhydrase/acetyltransferase-like protein (isoleucine patch superfamily)
MGAAEAETWIAGLTARDAGSGALPNRVPPSEAGNAASEAAWVAVLRNLRRESPVVIMVGESIADTDRTARDGEWRGLEPECRSQSDPRAEAGFDPGAGRCPYVQSTTRDIFNFFGANSMIRTFQGVRPTIPASCYVDDSAQIIGDVVLGEHSSVWMNAVVRGDVHEIRIGAYSNVQDNSVLHGMKQQWGVYLGDYVTVGHSVTLHGCVIEDRCLIGMGSIILNGARIGAGSIVAAGTLIAEKTVVEAGSLWMGSPGKFRRELNDADQETILRYARNYLGYKDEYLKQGT